MHTESTPENRSENGEIQDPTVGHGERGKVREDQPNFQMPASYHRKKITKQSQEENLEEEDNPKESRRPHAPKAGIIHSRFFCLQKRQGKGKGAVIIWA